jgi:hypothetical protein
VKFGQFDATTYAAMQAIAKKLRVVLLKPSKYRTDGFVERFRSGFMPNATLSHISSLTPENIGKTSVSVEYIDEYIRPDIDYLGSLHAEKDVTTLVAIVGVQSHQFHRAIDLSAYAKSKGAENVVIGGPHPMTCDTSALQNLGVSFSLSEAEIVWREIIEDAVRGQLQPVYGLEKRWADIVPDVKFKPPPPEEVNRHWVPMVGLYPVRGCPFVCNFCSVIKIAGRNVRHPSIDSIVSSLKTIKHAGVDLVVFTSDNFNKFPSAPDLLQAMIDEKLDLKFFFQADTQLASQPDLIDLVGRAGGVEVFVGAESFDKKALKSAHKRHNQPAEYKKIVSQCREAGIRTHFSNILGFPHQDMNDCLDHVDTLIDLGPEATPTFYHDQIDPEALQQVLFDAYENFYKASMQSNKHRIDKGTRNFMAFSRWCAKNQIHPMSGGSGRVKIDHISDYAAYRERVFGISGLLPLPHSLALSVADAELNRKARWA